MNTKNIVLLALLTLIVGFTTACGTTGGRKPSHVQVVRIENKEVAVVNDHTGTQTYSVQNVKVRQVGYTAPQQRTVVQSVAPVVGGYAGYGYDGYPTRIHRAPNVYYSSHTYGIRGGERVILQRGSGRDIYPEATYRQPIQYQRSGVRDPYSSASHAAGLYGHPSDPYSSAGHAR